MSWPNDDDGNVIRSLEKAGFDFSAEHKVDFNIDFEKWPAPQESLSILSTNFGQFRIIEPDEEDIENGVTTGYILLCIRSKVSYEFVTQMQLKLSRLMQPYGGWCNSWGVFSN